ncbi:hypothetical protein [Profundibacter sp.]
MTRMRSETPALLLHVGFHKTATTWMQQLLFTSAHHYSQVADHAEVFKHIVQPHGFHFDPAPMRAILKDRLASLDPGVVPVISSEILSGHPFMGGHESDVFAERLHRIAPQARILISIRAQMRIIPSVYTQYILRGGTMRPAQFFDGTDTPGYFGFTPKHFEYDHLVNCYQQLFGRDNVYVLTQESLQVDMALAAQRLAVFSGNTIFPGLTQDAQRIYAASYPEHALPILRRINHVQSSTLNPNPIIKLGRTPQGLYRAAGFLLRRPPFSNLLGKRKPVSDYVRNRFAGYYDDSNTRLAQLTDYPLDLSGYS